MKNDMRKWIFLKSDNPADALALATIIFHSEDTFYVVRRSIHSCFFYGLNNVIVDYYPNTKDDQLMIIDEIPIDSWQGKCVYYSERLGFHCVESDPYLGFVEHNLEVEKAWGDNCQLLLYLFPHSDQKLDLMLVDEITWIFKQKGISAVSGGTNNMPCIRNTMDLRHLVSLPVLCAIKDKISFILTSEKYLKAIGEALGIKVYVISDVDGLTIDNIPVNDASQIANYIETNNKIK